VSGDATFAREFFARYVVGGELPDYPGLLAHAGLLVRPAQPTAAWFGDTRLSADGGQVVVAGPTSIGSPMRTLGLSAGDRILTMDGATIETVEAAGINLEIIEAEEENEGDVPPAPPAS
jgi:predicted metalloprotease with PDZ domain